jgi:hypothetical protein
MTSVYRTPPSQTPRSDGQFCLDAAMEIVEFGHVAIEPSAR